MRCKFSEKYNFLLNLSWVNKSALQNFNWIYRLYFLNCKKKHVCHGKIVRSLFANLFASLSCHSYFLEYFSDKFIWINQNFSQIKLMIMMKNEWLNNNNINIRNAWTTLTMRETIEIQTNNKNKQHHIVVMKREVLNINQRSIVFFAEKSNCYRNLITSDQPWRELKNIHADHDLNKSTKATENRFFFLSSC